MTDAERCDLLARLLEEGTILIRDLVEEIAQYRAIDGRERDYLDTIDDVIGRRCSWSRMNQG